MLRIAICDDDKRFTGELEKIIIKECNIKIPGNLPVRPFQVLCKR